MRIPDTIRIGAQDYSASVSDVPGSHGNFGECNHSKLTIEIDSSSPLPPAADPHPRDRGGYGLRAEHRSQAPSGRALEGGLYGLIRDNPGLFGAAVARPGRPATRRIPHPDTAPEGFGRAARRYGGRLWSGQQSGLIRHLVIPSQGLVMIVNEAAKESSWEPPRRGF